MPNWCFNTINIETDGSISGDGFLAILRGRSQCPSRSFSLTSCAPVPGDLSEELFGPRGVWNWKLLNWGTIWDIAFQTREPRVDCSADGITIIGETPWTPPSAALDGLAAAFPHISITLLWEMVDIEGGITWRDALRIHDWETSSTHDVEREHADLLQQEGAARLSRYFRIPGGGF